MYQGPLWFPNHKYQPNKNYLRCLLLGLGFSIRGKGFSAVFLAFFIEPYWSLVKHPSYICHPSGDIDRWRQAGARLGLPDPEEPISLSFVLICSVQSLRKPKNPDGMGSDGNLECSGAWNMRKKQRFEDQNPTVYGHLPVLSQ